MGSNKVIKGQDVHYIILRFGAIALLTKWRAKPDTEFLDSQYPPNNTETRRHKDTELFICFSVSLRPCGSVLNLSDFKA